MASADQWRWTDDDGVQRLLSAEELRLAIVEGRLKPGTLVWRRGMPTWQPAETIAELMLGIDHLDTDSGQKDTGQYARPRPANLVDIDSLRAQQLKNPTLPYEAGGAARDFRLDIPAAPRLPDFSGAGAQAGQKQTRPRTATIDGPWQPNRPAREDQTVTNLRDDRANAARDPRAAANRGSSAPPPPPRGSPAHRLPGEPMGATGSRPPPPRSRRSVRGPKPTTTLVSENTGAPALGRGEGTALMAPEPPPPPPPAITLASPEPEAARAPATSFTAPLPGYSPEIAMPPFPSQPWAASSPAMPLPQMPRSDPGLAPADIQAIGQREPGFLVEPEPALQQPAGKPFSQRDWPLGASAAPADSRWSRWAGKLPSSLKALPVPPWAVAAGAGAIALLFSFIIGRATSSTSPAAPRAQAGWASVPLFTRLHGSVAEPRPCYMQSAPSRWADKAEPSIPMALLATAGGKLAIGYACSPTDKCGLLLAAGSGIAAGSDPPARVDDLARVVPVLEGDSVKFEALQNHQNGLQDPAYLRAGKPGIVGVADGSLTWLVQGGAEPKELWKLPGPIGKLQVAGFGPDAAGGFGVTYLTSGAEGEEPTAGPIAWYGAVKPDGAIAVQPTALEKTLGAGKPMIASDGREVSVVYADGKLPGDKPVVVRWARGPVGAALDKAPVVELPPGGPGGNAIAPDVSALSGGRWLLMWTEGGRGRRALRAQTYDRKGGRLGEALRVSPETGDFGQGTLAVVGSSVVGETVAVAFLYKIGETFQLWGTVLQCR